MDIKKLEDIDIKSLENSLLSIDKLFWKLRISRDKENINELEFLIYEFSNMVADIKRIYTRNWYRVKTEKDKKFIEARETEKSDLSTTKKINKEFANENWVIELQEMIVEYFEDKRKFIIRLADHISNLRIRDLSDAKRNDKI